MSLSQVQFIFPIAKRKLAQMENGERPYGHLSLLHNLKNVLLVRGISLEAKMIESKTETRVQKKQS